MKQKNSRKLTVEKTIIIIVAIFSVMILAGFAAGFEITSPEAATYNSTNISLSISHNETLDTITYNVDSGTEVLGCTNCSSYSTGLTLAEGNHTITATGNLGNDTFTSAVNFSILLPSEPVFNDFSITINSPTSGMNSTENIVNINIGSNISIDKISYALNNQTFVTACENCSNYNASLNLSNGNYTIYAQGKLSDLVKNSSAQFSVVVPAPINNNTGNGTGNETGNNTLGQNASFSLRLIKPEAKRYYESMVPLEIKSNTTLDSISYILDSGNVTLACSNCSKYDTKLNLSNGSHIISVFGTLGNSTVSINRSFSVNTTKPPRHDDDKNETEKSRFGKGFQKLPKIVAGGDITDEELAEIIKNNKLNPGVLNRLIKTGKLGNESINAILDTQFNPPGILRKILNVFNIKKSTFASLIYQYYNLSDKEEKKLFTRDDLDEEYKKSVKKKIEEKTEEKVKVSDEDDVKKSVKIGKQMKQDDDDEDDTDEDDKGNAKERKGIKEYNSDDDDKKNKKGNEERKNNGKNGEDDEDDTDEDDKGRNNNSNGKSKSNNGRGNGNDDD
jgi:hypothetical protein